MIGAIVSNRYLRGGKFYEPVSILCQAAESMNIVLEELTNDELAKPVGELSPEFDFIIFWDKDVACARNLELGGSRVFNRSDCIAICDDKAMTHMALCEEAVPSIQTIPCPMSFSEYDDLSFLDRAEKDLGYPMVVKDRFGSFGQQVHLARDRAEVETLLSGPYVPRILQPYIDCGATDIRVEVVGGEPVASVKRKGPEGDFRSNCTIGGTMKRYIAPYEVLDLAVRAADAVGADFAGVDIMVDCGEPVVCEVNSNAHIRNLLECTGRDVSYDILRHISETVG